MPGEIGSTRLFSAPAQRSDRPDVTGFSSCDGSRVFDKGRHQLALRALGFDPTAHLPIEARPQLPKDRVAVGMPPPFHPVTQAASLDTSSKGSSRGITR